MQRTPTLTDRSQQALERRNDRGLSVRNLGTQRRRDVLSSRNITDENDRLLSTRRTSTRRGRSTPSNLGLAAATAVTVAAGGALLTADEKALPDDIPTVDVQADHGDGYEMLVRKEAEASGLNEKQIRALPIGDLAITAAELNGGVTVHPNLSYAVPDIPNVVDDK